MLVVWKFATATAEYFGPIHSRVSWITQIWHFWHFCTKLKSIGFKIRNNKVSFSGNWIHWIRIAMPYPLNRSVIPYQSQIFRALIKSCSNKSKKWSFIQHMSGWQSGIGICLVIHGWLVLWVQFPQLNFLLILKPLDVHCVQKCQKYQNCVIWEKLVTSLSCTLSSKWRRSDVRK